MLNARFSCFSKTTLYHDTRDLRISIAYNVGTHDCEVSEMRSATRGSNHRGCSPGGQVPSPFWLQLEPYGNNCLYQFTEVKASGLVTAGYLNSGNGFSNLPIFSRLYPGRLAMRILEKWESLLPCLFPRWSCPMSPSPLFQPLLCVIAPFPHLLSICSRTYVFRLVQPHILGISCGFWECG